MTQYEITLSKRKCYVTENLSGGPTVFWAVDSMDDPARIGELVLSECADFPFKLIGFEIKDWNAELSPWYADGVFKDQSFAGHGDETLRWLVSDEVASFAEGKMCIAGYSLAGLFALWACCESDSFTGAASCSGSVWFPGWLGYIEGHRVNANTVYLSLGDREEKTKNPTMASVGDNTRSLSEKLGVAVVWHEGNHFRDADKRLAAGIAFLINHI